MPRRSVLHQALLSSPTWARPTPCSSTLRARHGAAAVGMLRWEPAFLKPEGGTHPPEEALDNCLKVSVFGSPGSSVGKSSPANVGDTRHGFSSWVGEIPWRKKWQPTPVSLPGKCHGQRSLAGCSPWPHRESGTTERLTRQTPSSGSRSGAVFSLPTSSA